jgi:hypothetical protein
MKALTPWYDIPLKRKNYQLPQYVDYNLFPLNIYEYQLHPKMLGLPISHLQNVLLALPHEGHQ